MAKRLVHGGVHVEGLDEILSDLRGASKDTPKRVTKVNRKVAKTVATRARSKAGSLGGVHAKVTKAIGWSSSPTVGRVDLKSSVHPAVFGAEFGGGKYGAGNPKSTGGQRPGYTSQFPPWRGSGSGAGYMVYPTIRDSMDHIKAEYLSEIDKLLKE